MIYLKTSVGIEIRRDDLLISCLQRNLSAGTFTHFTRVPNYLSRDRSEVRSEIERFFKTHRLSRDNVVLGIPRSDLIVRHLDLPAEVADNLKQVVQYQVQSFEPTEEDRFYYDYVLLKSNHGSRRLMVLLAMIRKAILDSHLGVLKDFGLRPVLVTGSTMALSNMFLQTCKGTEQKTFLLADVKADGIEIVALRDGALVYTHAAGVSGGRPLKDLLVGEAEQATGKIRLGPDEVIEKLVLSGEAAVSVQEELAGIVEDPELMGNRIQLEMSAQSKPHVHEAVTSLGLAYSGMVRRPPLKLNLLPPELRTHETRWAYIPAIAFGAAIVLILGGYFVRPIIQDRMLMEDLDREIAKLEPRVKRVQTLQSQVRNEEDKIRFIEGLLRNRDMNLEILRELTNLFPADTFLRSYSYSNDGKITLTGLSPSAEALIPKLEKSPLLKDVVQRGQVFRDQQTGKDTFTFEARLER